MKDVIGKKCPNHLYYDVEQTRAITKQVPKTSKCMNQCKLYRQTSLGL